MVDINTAIGEISLKELSLVGSNVFLMDYQKKMNIFLGSFPEQKISLAKEYAICDVIRLRFQPISFSVSEQSSLLMKKKIKKRTIKEAIKGV